MDLLSRHKAWGVQNATRMVQGHLELQNETGREKNGTGCRCIYFGNIPLALFPVKKMQKLSGCQVVDGGWE